MGVGGSKSAWRKKKRGTHAGDLDLRVGRVGNGIEPEKRGDAIALK